MFLWHTGSQERARAAVEHALDTAPGDAACTSLLGWILLHPAADGHVEPDLDDLDHASSLFEQTLQKIPKHVEVWVLGCLTKMASPCVTDHGFPPNSQPPSQNIQFSNTFLVSASLRSQRFIVLLHAVSQL